MSIGSTIKRLRRERDITQEQLAEYLGITSRAVSQWECDRTAPDISQLPALCHIFDVSSDVLLGIDIEKNNEEIERYLSEATELEHQGKFSERSMLLREANKRFPRDYRITVRLADALVCEYSRKGIKEYGEVFDLCRRIIAECTDSNTRYQAIETLGIAYGYAGREKELLKLAEEMPRARFSYEDFMVYRWKGGDGLKERQGYIHYLVQQLLSMIHCLIGHVGDDGKFVYTREERAELYLFELKLLDRLYPDGDYQYNAYFGATACYFLYLEHCRAGKYDEAWQWLEKCADYYIHADTYDFDEPHTTPILRGFSDGGWIMEAEGNYSQSMLDWLTGDEDAAHLRSDSRYEILVERLKKVAKKPQDT